MAHTAASLFLFFIALLCQAQRPAAEQAPGAAPAKAPPAGYEHYVAGSPADAQTQTAGGLALLGGGTDIDEAFRWMIRKSGGGDFVVIRASGTDAYNGYIRKLGALDSVETFVLKDRATSADPFVVERIRNAEALFIAGGDQWNYVSRWKGTPLAEAIQHLAARQAPIGGTSAGLAILGQFFFAAENGTVRSQEALADPYNRLVSVQRDFLALPNMQGIITDTHLGERDRMGRLVVFLARIVQDGWAAEARGIGVDRETAVLVEPDGAATVVGKNPAYFLKLSHPPETCKPGAPLTARGISVYRVTSGGKFDLRKWVGEGGTSCSFDVEAGVLKSTAPGGKIY